MRLLLPPPRRWDRLSRRRKSALLARFLRYYAHHFFRLPYRRSIPALGYRWPPMSLSERHRTALHHGVLNGMIDGYAELANERPPAQTGPLVVMFGRLMSMLDRGI